jgi:hypothetical protein
MSVVSVRNSSWIKVQTHTPACLVLTEPRKNVMWLTKYSVLDDTISALHTYTTGSRQDQTKAKKGAIPCQRGGLASVEGASIHHAVHRMLPLHSNSLQLPYHQALPVHPNIPGGSARFRQDPRAGAGTAHMTSSSFACIIQVHPVDLPW